MTPDQLYDLLPAVHRRRDAENGGQLRALLSVIAEQAGVVETDIERMYADWFIETCADWVVPYLGELVGYLPPPGAAAVPPSGTEEAQRLLASAVPRREVAATVANRRRKGTLALLEELARDVADWPARAVEYRPLLAITQPVRRYPADGQAARRRLRRGGLADLHRTAALDHVGGPFDDLARTAEVPRTGAARRSGRYNIPGVALHVWRLNAYPVTRAPAHCLDRARNRYTFSVLGNDTQLFTRPVPEPSPCHIADETNVPAPIGRRALAERLHDHYGPGKSLCVWVGDPDGEPVPLSGVVAADLSGWTHRSAPGEVAVDPVLGRIAFAPREAPETGVWVTYHYGFPADLGGGEYARPSPPAAPGARTPYRVGPRQEHGRITEALERRRADLEQWRDDMARWQGRRRRAGARGVHAAAGTVAGKRSAGTTEPPVPPSDVIEISGNEVHQDVLEIRLDRGEHLVLRAMDGSRPVLRLLDWTGNRPDALRIVGTGEGDGPPPRITLDGLLVTGRSVQVRGDVGQLVLRHCTFVPGWDLDEHCRPQEPEEPGLELVDTPVCVQAEHSILGTVVVSQSDAAAEPNRLWFSDSAIDATDRDLAALTGPEGRHAHAVLHARRTTVLGTVRVHATGLVEDCLLDGDVQVARRSEGCVRFSWLPPASRTPQRFHCEPEHSGGPAATALRFTSRRYGIPGYLQLAGSCPDSVRRGAEDGSEPGALHDLFQPQREDNLRTRLAEYAPAGCDTTILFVT
ncbi:hypothetical protein IPZ58_09520 [Streptomyces roseoverticillatus]|uniref:hypothetical protein n=1 Tax=Streptomyces roseoverticillatus TaxID=66429 RepID=UPI001F17D19B|nr:hypothetical protein [Streptomyces roseoverticillatus]MCF3101820.1 hypothetical protein [Streptomyces roseoverticillatus]